MVEGVEEFRTELDAFLVLANGKVLVQSEFKLLRAQVTCRVASQVAVGVELLDLEGVLVDVATLDARPGGSSKGTKQ